MNQIVNQIKKAANLIALTKHILVKLLPQTFGKVGGRQYGYTFDSNLKGKVVPYISVNTPSENEFGYHYEALAYQLATSVQFDFDEQDISSIANQKIEEARYFANRDKISIDDTEEAKEFLELTGVNLLSMENNDSLKKQACENIKKDLRKRLYIGSMFASKYITFYDQRLTSTAHSLVDQFSTFRGGTGTPWNQKGYTLSLGDNLHKDEGAEGSIIYQLLKRAKENAGKHSVHIVKDEASPHNILKQVFETHPDKERIFGFQDAGGIFILIQMKMLQDKCLMFLIIHISKELFFSQKPLIVKHQIRLQY